MEVKIKKLSEKAVIPTYSKYGDAGMDITATSVDYDEHRNIVYGTDLSFEIPDNYLGLLFPRSSNAKKELLLTNSVGVLDSGYRGEVVFKFKESHEQFTDKIYGVGDRIGQIIILPYPKIEFVEVDELSETNRGSGGFGSTGN